MAPSLRPSPGRHGALSIAALLALAGCDINQPAPGTTPRMRPQAPQVQVPVDPSAESRAMARHYARVEQDLQAQGLMRVDGGGVDTPFNARMLVQNFIRIALYDEYDASSGTIIAKQTPSRLRRWETPIRMNVVFGASIPLEQREADQSMVAGYATRLSALTGVPIRMGPSGANFHVLILNEDERRTAAPRLRALMPGIPESAVGLITGMERSTFCVAFAFSGENSAYTQAIAVIRGEHPPLLRRSCVHEELAQAMGLANDSPAARPTIFNDDEEFALLTHHDELLLKILYDPRLRTGMTPEQARPIVEVIAAELLGGES